MNDSQLIESQLRQLEPAKVMVFCSAVAQRQFPNFALFSNIVEFGDSKKMATLLDGVWQSLVPGGAQMNFTLQLNKVEENMPDVEDFDMYGVSPALDAITCLHATVTCLLECDVEEAITISQLSRETVASFIEVTQADDQMSDAEVMRLISNHELMEQEDGFQKAVLEQLQSASGVDKQLIKSIRELADNQGFSNIGICV